MPALVCLVALVGCAGGGSAPSDNESEGALGPLTSRAVGTAQAPVISTAANSVVMGIAGASFSSVIQNRTTDSLSLTNTRFAFIAPDAAGVSQVFTVPAAGGTPTQLTSSPTHKRNPSWSPNGAKVAFVSTDSSGYYQVFTMAATGGASTQITTGTREKDSPRWSPNGATIVYAERNANGYYQIVTLPAAGGTPLTLTSGDSHRHNPTWSPSGALLAFESPDTNGYYQIYTMPATGGAVLKLTTGGSHKTSPAWSPNGALVAYRSDDTVSYQLYLVPQSGGAITQLTSGNAYRADPDWAPNGTTLSYQGVDANSTNRLFTIPVGGGAPTLVNTDGYEPRSAAWSGFLAAPVTLVGAGGLLGTGAAGFLLGQSGDSVRSVLAFDTLGSTLASRAAARVANLTPPGVVSSNLVFSITAADALIRLNYSNYDSVGVPRPAVNVALATGTTGALVSYNAATGAVATVLPYTATKSVGSGVLQTRQEGDALVVTGSFTGVYDAQGVNQASGGARTVRIDLETGKATPTR